MNSEYEKNTVLSQKIKEVEDKNTQLGKDIFDYKRVIEENEELKKKLILSDKKNEVSSKKIIEIEEKNFELKQEKLKNEKQLQSKIKILTEDKLSLTKAKKANEQEIILLKKEKLDYIESQTNEKNNILSEKSNKKHESSIMSFMKANTNQLIKVSIEGVLSSHNLIISENIGSDDNGICELPDENLFIISSLSTVCCIIDCPQNKVIQFSCKKAKYAIGGLAYNNNFVYSFGYWSNGKDSEKYDLSSKEWNDITPLPVNGGMTSCVANDENIYIVGYNNSDIIMYNVWRDYYKYLKSCISGSYKIIVKGKNRAYVFTDKMIYESNENEFFSWKSIESNVFIDNYAKSFCLTYKDSIYFVTRSKCLYQFGLVTKELKLICNLDY